MPLPTLTHFQFGVLNIILAKEMSGRDVRGELKSKFGIRKSGPAFYQAMSRLEDSGFVKGWYEQKVVDGQAIKERRYKITGHGARAWEKTRDFYIEADAVRGAVKAGRVLA